MKLVDIPTKFNIPFGSSAGAGYIRPIPQASQIGIQAGAASLTDGFPPVTFLQVGAGGTPPWGEDFNGILNQITLWNRWQAAGGLAPFDSTFAAAIGGYPKSAIVASAVAGACWISVIDDNPNDPDAVGTGWVIMGSIGKTRIVTASGVFVINRFDQSIGLARVSSVATSSSSLPSDAVAGEEFNIEDLTGNFNAFPVTISAPGGMTIIGAPSVVLNVDGQSSTFRFYGSNLWSWKP